MKKYEKIKQDIILNGYNDIKGDKLANLYVSQFLDNEEEKLSDIIDMYINDVKKGVVLPNEFNSLKFADVALVDNDEAEKDIVFESFKNVVNNKFNLMCQMEPLQSVLLQGGAMNYYKDMESYGCNPYFFNKDIFKLFDSSYLCSIHPLGHDFAFIKLNNLIELLKSKGLSEGYLMVEKTSGIGFDLLFDYDVIINLGKNEQNILKRV